MKIIPEIEFWSEEQIAKLQLSKLKGLLNYVAEHSAFYKKHFSGLDLEISSLEDIRTLPVTSKEDLQLYNWDFLCVDKSQVAEYCTTSGTLGKPVTIALSQGDIERLAYNEAISFSCAGGSQDDLYHLMLTLDRGFMAGIAYYEGIRKLGAGLVRMGPGLPQLQWETIQRLKPTTIVAVPSFIVKLLEHALNHDIDFKSCSVRKIICIGESIRDHELKKNTLGRKIKELWNVELYSTYASTEMQTAFTECEHEAGGHLHPELIMLEILDDAGSPVIDGEPGEVTITTFGVEAMPLVRYKTGDVARLFNGTCKCGRKTLRLGPVEGRKQHMLKFKGTTVFPPAIFDVLNNQNLVQDYVVEAFRNAVDGDGIKISILLKGECDLHSVKRDLEREFQSVLRVIPEIVFIDFEQFERLSRNPASPKQRRFIDSR